MAGAEAWSRDGGCMTVASPRPGTPEVLSHWEGKRVLLKTQGQGDAGRVGLRSWVPLFWLLPSKSELS